MKILITSQYWQPENGVPQRRWTWLVHELINQGHEVWIVAPQAISNGWFSLKAPLKFFKILKGREVGNDGEVIFRSPYVAASNSITSRAIAQFGIAFGTFGTVVANWRELRHVDLVIGTVPALPTAFVAAMSAKLVRKPYAIDLRDAWPDLLKDFRRWNEATGKMSMRERLVRVSIMPALKFVVEKTFGKVISSADIVLVTSSDLQKRLENGRALSSRRNKQQIETIRNVFPSATEIAERRAARTSDGTLRILYAGTLGRAQNLKNALNAAILLKEKGLSIELKFVGAGAAKPGLTQFARDFDIPVTFDAVRPAQALDEYYEWADTALVHLTDWEPLSRAVPSKTYELMAQGIHISCVANGEVAELVRTYDAGHVVSPEQPHELAALWEMLIESPELLNVPRAGRDWVTNEREVVVPRRISKVLKTLQETD